MDSDNEDHEENEDSSDNNSNLNGSADSAEGAGVPTPAPPPPISPAEARAQRLAALEKRAAAQSAAGGASSAPPPLPAHLPVLPIARETEAAAQRAAAAEARMARMLGGGGSAAAAASPPPAERHHAVESLLEQEAREARARAAEARLRAAPRPVYPPQPAAAPPPVHAQETPLETEARLARARAAEARARIAATAEGGSSAAGAAGAAGAQAQRAAGGGGGGADRDSLWAAREALEAEAARQRKALGSVANETVMQLAAVKEAIAHLHDGEEGWAALSTSECVAFWGMQSSTRCPPLCPTPPSTHAHTQLHAQRATHAPSHARRKEVGQDLARKQEFARAVRVKEEQRRALILTALEAQEAQAAREVKAGGAVSAVTSKRLAELRAELEPRAAPLAVSPEVAITRLVTGLTVQASGKACAAFLLQVVGNILGAPGEAKYRRLRCSAAAFQDKVMGASGGQALLLQAGFQQVQEAAEGGSAEVFLAFKGEDFALLRALQQAIMGARGAFV